MPKNLHPKTLIAFACIIAIIITAGVVNYLLKPTVLTVAVDNASKPRFDTISAFAQNLASTHAPINLKLINTSSLAQSAATLDANKADLAVTRSLELPVHGQTLAILQRNPIIFIANRSSRISKVSNLKHHTLGVTEQSAASQKLLQKILAQQNLTLSDVKLVTIDINQVGQSLMNNKIDCMMLTIPLQGDYLQKMLNNIEKQKHSEPVIFGVEDADAIIQRFPQLESYEIKQGAFSSHPLQPDDDITTLAYSERLTANAKLSNNTVGDVTRLLFTLKPAISHQAPAAHTIDAIETEQAIKYDLHPGALTYYNGEEKSFMERYSDEIYIGMSVITGLASLIGALIGFLIRRRQALATNLVLQVEGLLIKIRQAQSIEALHQVLAESDELFAKAIKMSNAGQINAEQFALFAAVSQHVNLAAQQTTLEIK